MWQGDISFNLLTAEEVEVYAAFRGIGRECYLAHAKAGGAPLEPELPP